MDLRLLCALLQCSNTDLAKAVDCDEGNLSKRLNGRLTMPPWFRDKLATALAEKVKDQIKGGNRNAAGR